MGEHRAAICYARKQCRHASPRIPGIARFARPQAGIQPPASNTHKNGVPQ